MPFHRVHILLFLSWGAANGQQLTPIKPTLHTGPGRGETQIIEPISKPALNGTALATLYRKYAGLRVIVSAAAATAEFRLFEDASPEHPLTFARAAECIRKAALQENFAFAPDGHDHNLDILTFANAGSHIHCGGVPIYQESDTLPEADPVISYVMIVKSIKPADAVTLFTKRIGKFSPYGSIAPVPNASALVITENTLLIRKLIDLKNEIDRPQSHTSSR